VAQKPKPVEVDAANAICSFIIRMQRPGRLVSVVYNTSDMDAAIAHSVWMVESGTWAGWTVFDVKHFPGSPCAPSA
jgi:hypothetical protein